MEVTSFSPDYHLSFDFAHAGFFLAKQKFCDFYEIWIDSSLSFMVAGDWVAIRKAFLLQRYIWILSCLLRGLEWFHFIMYKSLIHLNCFLAYSGRYGSNFYHFPDGCQEIFFNWKLVQNAPENAFFRKRSRASAEGVVNYNTKQFSLTSKDLFVQRVFAGCRLCARYFSRYWG